MPCCTNRTAIHAPSIPYGPWLITTRCSALPDIHSRHHIQSSPAGSHVYADQSKLAAVPRHRLRPNPLVPSITDLYSKFAQSMDIGHKPWGFNGRTRSLPSGATAPTTWTKKGPLDHNLQPKCMVSGLIRVKKALNISPIQGKIGKQQPKKVNDSYEIQAKCQVRVTTACGSR